MPDAGATGAAVQVGGARTVADSNGDFSVNATPPFNAVAASYSATLGAALYSGYYQTSATSLRMMGSSIEPGALGLTSGSLQAMRGSLLALSTQALNLEALQERADTLSRQIGTLAVATSQGNVSGTGSGAHASVTVRITVADGVRSLTTIATSDATGNFTWTYPDFFWAGTGPRTVHIGAYSTDGTTHRFARTTAIIPRNGNTTGVTIPALAAVTTATVNFTLNAATGTTFQAGGATGALYPVSTSGGVAMHIHALSTTILTIGGGGTQATGSVTAPNLGSYLAYGFGTIDDPPGTAVGQNYVNWGQVSPGSSVTIPIYRSPGPVTGPTGPITTLDPTWTIQPRDGHTTQILELWATSGTAQQDQWWLVAAAGNATTIKLPLASAIGATLNPNTSYDWWVYAFTHGPCPPIGYSCLNAAWLTPDYDLPFALANRVGFAFYLTPSWGAFTTPAP